MGGMPAYLIARVDITDLEQYRQYLNATPLIMIQIKTRLKFQILRDHISAAIHEINSLIHLKIYH